MSSPPLFSVSRKQSKAGSCGPTFVTEVIAPRLSGGLPWSGCVPPGLVLVSSSGHLFPAPLSLPALTRECGSCSASCFVCFHFVDIRCFPGDESTRVPCRRGPSLAPPTGRRRLVEARIPVPAYSVRAARCPCHLCCQPHTPHSTFVRTHGLCVQSDMDTHLRHNDKRFMHVSGYT